MGRRARRRAGASPAPPTTPRGAQRGGRERAFDRLPAARRVLAVYVAIAMAVAVAVILGIAALGGALGPYVVVAYALLAAALAHRWASGRLASLTLSDEDRMMQTLAGGLLLLSVVLAVASCVVLAVT